MENPQRIEFDEKTVEMVAQNVVAGNISRHWRDGRNLFYYQTFRPTGEDAPTAGEMELEMVKMFQAHPEEEEIEAQQPIDVYVYAALEDEETQFPVLVVAI